MKNGNKNTISITRGDIYRMVNESVSKILLEFDPHETSWYNMPDPYDGGGDERTKDINVEFKISDFMKAMELYANKNGSNDLLESIDAIRSLMSRLGVLNGDVIQAEGSYTLYPDSYDNRKENVEIVYNSNNDRWFREITNSEEISNEAAYDFEEFYNTINELIEKDFVENGTDKNYFVNAYDLLDYSL